MPLVQLESYELQPLVATEDDGHAPEPSVADGAVPVVDLDAQSSLPMPSDDVGYYSWGFPPAKPIGDGFGTEQPCGLSALNQLPGIPVKLSDLNCDNFNS